MKLTEAEQIEEILLEADSLFLRKEVVESAQSLIRLGIYPVVAYEVSLSTFKNQKMSDLKLNNELVENAKDVLRKYGYYVDCLWSVDDVYDVLDVDGDDELAQQILDATFNSDWLTEKIFEVIEDTGVEEFDLKPR